MRAVVVTVIAALLVGAAVYLLQLRPAENAVSNRAPANPVPSTTQDGDAPRRRPQRAKLDEGVPAPYAQQFQQSRDLWPFAEQMLRMALEGDDAAQFWLSRALERCGYMYDEAFDVEPSDPHPLTLDDAVQREQQEPYIGVAEVTRLHEQCARMRGPEAAKFGKARDWLEKASASGYPPAQIWRAYYLLDDPLSRDAGSARNRARARDLTLAALRSGDADVIRQAEAVVTQLVQGESAREQHHRVWTIAGCLRGALCGPDADWVRAECVRDRKCQPYEGGLDIIRRQTGAQYAELEEEARELGEKIDRQRWEDLGF